MLKIYDYIASKLKLFKRYLVQSNLLILTEVTFIVKLKKVNLKHFYLSIADMVVLFAFAPLNLLYKQLLSQDVLNLVW